MPRARASVRVVSSIAVLFATSITLPTATAHDDPTALRLPCDPLDKSLCLLPFPNDRFTRADARTASFDAGTVTPVQLWVACPVSSST